MKKVDVLRRELNSYLMRYGRAPAPSIAGNVVGCLEELVVHPDFHADFRERCVCKQMLTFWRLLAE